MKLLDKLTHRFGIDRITHCSAGANITFMVVLAWWLFDWKQFVLLDLLCAFLLSGIITLIAAVIKEKLDDYIDRKDIIWTMLGWLFACIFIFVMLILAVIVYNFG